MSTVLLIEKESKREHLKRLVHGMSVDIFTSLGITAEGGTDEIQHNVLEHLDNVNVVEVSKYLEQNDAVHTQALIKIMQTCIKDVLADNKIGLDDVPILIDAVSKASALVSEMHRDRLASARMTRVDTAILLEALFVLVLQIALPVTQHAIVISILHSVFQVLTTQIVPLFKHHHLCCLFPQLAK